jgi:hypothetical protein
MPALSTSFRGGGAQYRVPSADECRSGSPVSRVATPVGREARQRLPIRKIFLYIDHIMHYFSGTFCNARLTSLDRPRIVMIAPEEMVLRLGVPKTWGLAAAAAALLATGRVMSQLGVYGHYRQNGS